MPRVVITGPPGAPTAELSALVAAELGVEWASSDDELARLAGRSAAEVLIDDGEQAFRAVERQACERLLTEKNVAIIELGGGAVLDPTVAASVSDLRAAGGAVVFVDTTIAHAARALGLNMSHATPVINPRTQWLRQFEARRPVYERLATVTVLADGRPLAELVQQVTETLNP